MSEPGDIEAKTGQVQPFKGAESFLPWERRRFFGRDHEAVELRSLVLANTMSLLHAPSGAGKTSLVNAGLAPTLEFEQSWLTVVARPAGEPSLEARTSIILRLFPSPAAERAALDRIFALSKAAAEASGEPRLEIGPDLALDEARATFDALAQRGPEGAAGAMQEPNGDADAPILDERHWGAAETLRSDVLGDLEADVPFGDGVAQIRCSPTVQRYLDQSRGPRLLVRHLASVAEWCRENGVALDWPPAFAAALATGTAEDFRAAVSTLTLASLREVFATPGLDEAWQRFIGRHLRPGDTLLDFLIALRADWFDMEVFDQNAGMPLAPPQGVVLILDQFEEMFTRFGGEAARRAKETTGAKSMSLEDRRAFFEELRAVYEACEAGDRSVTPVKMLISMRDEHIAELGEIRAFAPDLTAASYRLNFLSEAVARDVIEQSASRYGFTIVERVLEDVVSELAREDGSVEPVMFQIVFGYLWKEHGETIVARMGAGGRAQLDWAMYADANGIEEILRNYVFGVIEGADSNTHSAIETFELLTILDALIMGGDRRAIIERDLLIHQPGHPHAVREHMLDVGIRGGLIRLDRRISGAEPFAEVTHERLIEPITKAIVQLLRSNPQLQALQAGLSRLSHDRLRDLRRSHHNALTGPEVDALDSFGEELELDAAGSEIVYRSAVIRGSASAVTARWAERVAAHASIADPANVLASAASRVSTQHWIDRSELRDIAEAEWQGANDTASAKLILNSLLNECDASDHDLLRSFARRVSDG